MAKSFKTLRHKLSELAQKEASEKAIVLLKEMHLQELRQSRYLSQERIAEILKTKQANISKLEQRSDMHVSTLRTYIEAMGGKLDIVAIFPEGKVHINQFNDFKS